MKQRKQNRNNTKAKTHEETSSTSENSKTTQHPKNIQESKISECYNIHRRNHDNFGNLRKTIEKSLRHQSDPSGNTMNLTKNSFTKTE